MSDGVTQGTKSCCLFGSRLSSLKSQLHSISEVECSTADSCCLKWVSSALINWAFSSFKNLLFKRKSEIYLGNEDTLERCRLFKESSAKTCFGQPWERATMGHWVAKKLVAETGRNFSGRNWWNFIPVMSLHKMESVKFVRKTTVCANCSEGCSALGYLEVKAPRKQS